MSSIVTQVEIDREPEEVFAYVTDPANFSEWQDNVTGGHMDDGPTRVGSICSTTRRIGGSERSVSSEVTVLDPPRAWAVRGTDGPIRSMVNVAVEPIGDGQASRVTIDLDFAGHGIGKVLVPLLVRPQSRKEMQRNVARLKSRLESAG
ncbi:SRPBCC family protein [Kribbella qitaiheensis]|uniref:SRPBCC family protein n=1 Tax=Kribbella qitaiheensis TaxID=1544730 RepID=A0A7G6X5C6_9ACTN|nr:SRPBCC family protein [Kribbella qitaiheensis]QNE21441.1 SRPBCC family protein [Kribbella qitaiheensis]